MPSLGSAMTGLHQELPTDSLEESLVAMACRTPSVALGLIYPWPQQSLGQRRGDLKPL